jgi:hypothetical protein
MEKKMDEMEQVVEEDEEELENVKIEGVPESEKAEFIKSVENFFSNSGIIVISQEK